MKPFVSAIAMAVALAVPFSKSSVTSASAQDAPDACDGWGEHRSVPSFLDCARAATEKYQDQAIATLEGYRRIGGDFPAMGEHWINVSLVFDGRLDAASPQVLTYVVVAGRPRLLGIAYALPLLPGESAPEWPAGADAWHDHSRTIESETLLPQHEAHAPHAAPSARLAMLHAWLWTDNPDGVFAAENWTIPFVRLGLTAPPDAPAAAGKALSLVAGGTDHLLMTIEAAAPLNVRERGAVNRAVNGARHAAMAVLERRLTSMVTAADATRLAGVWNRLWPRIDAAVAPAAADRVRRLAIR